MHHKHIGPTTAVWLLVLLLINFGLAGCASAPKPAISDLPEVKGLSSQAQTAGRTLTQPPPQPEPEEKQPLGLIQKVLAAAYSQMGLPYKYGGTSPDTGFDCAGFTQWAYAQHSVEIPRTSRSQLGCGRDVDLEEVQPGDLLIYKRRPGSRQTHVGMYSGGGMFLHSPHTGDRIKESQAFSPYRKPLLLGIRRVVDEECSGPLPDDVKQKIIKQALAANAPKKAAPAKRTRQASYEGPVKEYRVKQGDSMWLIARRHKVRLATLLKINGLPRRHTLNIGREIKIPVKEDESTDRAETTGEEASPKKAARPNASSKTYHVQRGDTIWVLARRFGVSPDNLLRVNNLGDKHTLKIGQRLAIP